MKAGRSTTIPFRANFVDLSSETYPSRQRQAAVTASVSFAVPRPAPMSTYKLDANCWLGVTCGNLGGVRCVQPPLRGFGRSQTVQGGKKLREGDSDALRVADSGVALGSQGCH